MNITKENRIIKVIILILIVCMTLSTNVFAVEPGLENLVGPNQVRDTTYMLDDRPVYTYMTSGGGYINRTAHNNDYHIYEAEPKTGWKFIRWVTYYYIGSSSYGQNSTISLTDTWYFSTPGDDETKADYYSSKIRVNNEADIVDYSEKYKLYAVFEPIRYTIVFNGNGSTSGYMYSQGLTYGTSQKLNNNTYEKKGYTFDGWNTSNDGSGADYTNGQEVNNMTTKDGETITLYAKWTPADLTGTVTITGEEKVGKTLTASVENTNNTGVLSYQWQRNGQNITGANENIYTLTQQDMDKRISCIVTSSVQTKSISNTTGLINGEITVKYNLTNITSDGKTISKLGQEYATTFVPKEKYKLPEDISVKISGVELSAMKYSYDWKNCKLTIPANEVNGDIEITAVAIKIPQYKVTINEVEGATITPNGVIDEILEGSNLDINIKAEEGYKIIAIKINDIEQDLPLNEDILTLRDINEDMNIVVEVEKEEPKQEESENENEGQIQNKENDNNTNNPQTSDNIILFVAMFIISVMGIVITTKFRKNK